MSLPKLLKRAGLATPTSRPRSRQCSEERPLTPGQPGGSGVPVPPPYTPTPINQLFEDTLHSEPDYEGFEEAHQYVPPLPESADQPSVVTEQRLTAFQTDLNTRLDDRFSSFMEQFREEFANVAHHSSRSPLQRSSPLSKRRLSSRSPEAHHSKRPHSSLPQDETEQLEAAEYGTQQFEGNYGNTDENQQPLYEEQLEDHSRATDASIAPPPIDNPQTDLVLTEEVITPYIDDFRRTVLAEETRNQTDPVPEGFFRTPRGSHYYPVTQEFKFENLLVKITPPDAEVTISFHQGSYVFTILRWTALTRRLHEESTPLSEEKSAPRIQFSDISRVTTKPRKPSLNFTTEVEKKMIILTLPPPSFYRWEESITNFKPDRPFTWRSPPFHLEAKFPFIKALQSAKWNPNDSLPAPLLSQIGVPALTPPQITQDFQLRQVLLNSIRSYAATLNSKQLIESYANLGSLKDTPHKFEIKAETTHGSRFISASLVPLEDAISYQLHALSTFRHNLRKALLSKVRQLMVSNILVDGFLISEKPFDKTKVTEAVEALNSAPAIAETLARSMLTKFRQEARPQAPLRTPTRPQLYSRPPPDQRHAYNVPGPSTSSYRPHQPLQTPRPPFRSSQRGNPRGSYHNTGNRAPAPPPRFITKKK